MQTWIFKSRSSKPDAEELFSTVDRDILYAAYQGVSEMRPGDTFYLWRSENSSRELAGIFAKGSILETKQAGLDVQGKPVLLTEASLASSAAPSVRLRISEIANKKEVIQSKWLFDDPVLHDLTILKNDSGSNFLLPLNQVKRLNHLWSRTGATWTRAESIAALQTYHTTYQMPLSRRPTSPIADTALLIGRAVTGVYNKVLNFRSIDPRDSRAGLSGAGAGDKVVWDEFFDASTNTIKSYALEAAFRDLWVDQSETEISGKVAEPDKDKEQDGSPPKYRPGPTQGGRDYTVSKPQHTSYYVYVLELSNKKALKIGYSHEPKKREQAYNLSMAEEVTGLRWTLTFTHELKTAKDAERLEQEVLSEFSAYQLTSNGEILKGVSSDQAMLAIIRRSSF